MTRHALLLCSLLTLSAAAFAQDKPWPQVVRQIVTPISPFFPEAMRAKGVRHAVVKLELTIGPDGIVQIAKIISGATPEFDDSALTTAKLTVFAAAKTTTMQPFTVTFDLR